MENAELRRTALFARHQQMGARLVPFAGWEMPVQYSGIIEEHQAVRTAAGLFDISHMGQVHVRGPDALAFLEWICTARVAALPAGMSGYSLMCHPHGGIIDDVFVYHLPDRYLVVVNASNQAKDVAWMQQQAARFDVQVEDVSDQTCMLAVQGPQAEPLVAAIATPEAAALPFHGVIDTHVLGEHLATVARTGYTGEDGFEIFVHTGGAEPLWDALLAAGTAYGLKPCGLGARDSLRFEPCLPLYGHEIADDINPYEARLGWVVKLDKGEFVGSAALAQVRAAGPARRLVGLEMIGRGIARAGYLVHSPSGEPVGSITTGMPSPTLGTNLAMALVPAALSEPGSELDVLVRDKPVRARVVRMPFYKPRYKK